MAKKEKEQKPVLTFDDKEYVIEDMTDEQKGILNHINDLQNKMNSMQFNLDQLSVGKDAFISKLREALEEPEAEVVEEVEA
jgi:predicted  nucleic acid-binding Zn-ribbon protein